MRKFAQLTPDGVTVHCVFDWDVEGHSPVYHPSIPQPVEVTDLDPQPETGWIYDPGTGIFTAPPPPAP
jgi:hypothetical protein